MLNSLWLKKSYGQIKNLSKSMMSTSSKIAINVQQGTVLGKEEQLPNGNKYYSFKGIPYAKKPIGNLRFQAPVPVDKFPNNELECYSERDVSYHRDPFTSSIVGAEDCLYLNVYVPDQEKSSKPYAVMVWVHGGGYMFGSGNSDFYSPLYLLQENVVVVTLNYRLGVFGFLSYPEQDIPGNAGLKDQALALKWVHDNIKQFNGDSNNVTFFGESAGAASVHLHSYSENSKKLFHKAIIQSGTLNMEWVLQKDPTRKAKKLANLLGCTSSSDPEIAQFLRTYNKNIDILKHMLAVLTPDEKRRGLPMPFKPVIEKSSPDAIVTKPLLESLLEPNCVDIPIMMGYNSGEGLTMIPNAIKKLNELENDLARVIPRSLNLHPDDPKSTLLVNQIRDFYFKGKSVTMKTLNELTDLMGDYYFNIGANQAAEIHSKRQHNSPLYFYQFGYVGDLNMYKKIFQLDNLKGACHADELFYLFQSNVSEVKPNTEDEQMVIRICRMWANFAKYGNPTPDNDEFLNVKWKPVKKLDDKEEFVLDYLEIDRTLKMRQNPDKERIDFWREVFKTWNKGFLKPKL